VLVRLALRLVILAVAVALTTWLLPGVHVSGGVLTYLWIALLFALVNAILGPILHLVALPLTVLTFGLFALVVNTALVAITAGLSSHFAIDSFWAAFFAAILITVIAGVLNLLIRRRRT
jgi:putative membrane protein